MSVHILYVEDDETSRTVMELLLTYWSERYDLTVFADSEEFLQRLQRLQRPPDLIFLDIHVLPLSGFDMLKVLRQTAEYQDVKVIALTASVMNEEIQKLKQAGFDGALAKPLDRGSFPQLLSRIMAGETVWYVN